MKSTTSGDVHWRGIGGPPDLLNVERSKFADAVRSEVHQQGYTFERVKGAAAMARGEGASGYHIYGYTLPDCAKCPEEASASIEGVPTSRKRAAPSDSDSD